MNREQKAEAIAAIAERLGTADTVIATAFHGLSVREVEGLRAALREAGGQFQVVKNTLARRACDQAGREALVEYLQGETALVWAAGDAAGVAKALQAFSKATEDRLTMKGGFMEGSAISADELKTLASLPSRDELLARLVGGVASPLQGAAGALGALLSGIAVALGRYHVQRAAEAPAADAAGGSGDAANTPEAAQEPAADDNAEAAQEPAADETTEGD